MFAAYLRARAILAFVSLTALCAVAEPKPAPLVSAYVEAAGFAEPEGQLTLRDAVQAALLGHPLLNQQWWETRVRDAIALQAGLAPNPSLSIEVENAPGSGQREGFSQAETTVGLSQMILLGGKRTKSRALADNRTELARWDYEIARIAVFTSTAKDFVATLAAQQRLDLLTQLDQAAAESVDLTAAQVTAGAAPIAARTRAEVLRLSIDLDRQRAARALAASRVALAANWGSTVPRYSTLRGDLRRDVEAPPPLEELLRRIESNPDLARWATELAEREAAVALERARAIPDPTLGLFGRHYAAGDDAALVFSVSVPLPVFDRNRGNVLAAAHDAQKARAERATAALAVKSALTILYQELVASHEQIAALQGTLLPAADQAYSQTFDGYGRGIFRYVDVLDAQRTLYQFQLREIDELAAYHQARADVERLIGEPIDAEAER